MSKEADLKLLRKYDKLSKDKQYELRFLKHNEILSKLTPEQKDILDHVSTYCALHPVPISTYKNYMPFKKSSVNIMKQTENESAEIPDWIIKYDQNNYQSSAGRAIRFLLGRVQSNVSKQTSAELDQALDEYMKLLGEELNETSIIAHNHGWRSKRVEQGELLRKKIAELRKINHSK